MRRSLLWIGLLLNLALTLPAQATPPPAIRVQNNDVVLEFPERITFRVELESEAVIQDLVLEYGTEQLTCGTVVAKAFPDFAAHTRVRAEWTWEMRQGGAEPPGATIWWRWRARDWDGRELLTEIQRVTWIDDVHPWQVLNGKEVNIHWYAGDEAYAQAMLSSAETALERLANDIGLQPGGTIEVYLYASQSDLRDAVLYEPQWVGGQAYPEHNIVIMAVGPQELEWGRQAMAHELTHVVQGHYTFSCLGQVPAWLVEGLAVYGQGGMDPAMREEFDAALADDTLLSVRALVGNFPEDPTRADVAYGQSYSLVDYLIKQYGKEKILALMRMLRAGVPTDQAMPQVYGLTLEQFEEEWRAAIGARPHTQAGQSPTPTAIPTPVPTLPPVRGMLPTATALPTARPTAMAPSTPASEPAPAGPISSWIVILAVGIPLLALLIAGSLVVWFRHRRRGV